MCLMSETIVLSDRGDERKIIEEEKQEWLVKVLLALGVNEGALDLEANELVQYLSMAGIEVWSNYDGSLDIFRFDGDDNKKMVAQWKVPDLVLIKDTPKKWYYEIHINEWALPFQMEKRRR
jgi:hypothetical protein